MFSTLPSCPLPPAAIQEYEQLCETQRNIHVQWAKWKLLYNHTNHTNHSNHIAHQATLLDPLPFAQQPTSVPLDNEIFTKGEALEASLRQHCIQVYAMLVADKVDDAVPERLLVMTLLRYATQKSLESMKQEGKSIQNTNILSLLKRAWLAEQRWVTHRLMTGMDLTTTHDAYHHRIADNMRRKLALQHLDLLSSIYLHPETLKALENLDRQLTVRMKQVQAHTEQVKQQLAPLLVQQQTLKPLAERLAQLRVKQRVLQQDLIRLRSEQ